MIETKEQEGKRLLKEIAKSLKEQQDIFDRNGINFSIKKHWKKMVASLELEKKVENKKYLVEECDIFYSHIDHNILGWFDNLEEAKELCDKKAKDSYYFYVYCVYEPKKDSGLGEEYDNCVYEAKGVVSTPDRPDNL